MTYSVVLYGDIKCDFNHWQKWIDYSLHKFEEINIKPNYAGINGDSFKSGKIQRLKIGINRVINSLKAGELVSSISFYALPDNFKQAAFDYEAYMGRTTIGKIDSVIIILNQSLFECLNIEKTIEELKDHIDYKSGEVFKLLNTESPHIYVSKGNDPSVFKSLRIIMSF